MAASINFIYKTYTTNKTLTDVTGEVTTMPAFYYIFEQILQWQILSLACSGLQSLAAL